MSERASDLAKRLMASVRYDAINGDAMERGVCKSQMREASNELARLAVENAKLKACVEAADQMRSIAIDEPGGASDWCYYDVAREELDWP